MSILLFCLSLLMPAVVFASGAAGPQNSSIDSWQSDANQELDLRGRCQRAIDLSPTVKGEKNGVLDEQLLLEMMADCARPGFSLAELRLQWTQLLATSDFLLKGDEGPVTLVDLEMPNSRPHWDEPRDRGDVLHPWTSSYGDEDRARQQREDAFRAQEAAWYRSSSRLFQLFGSPVLQQWTLEWTGRMLEESRRDASRCALAQKGYRALYLLSGGSVPDTMQSGLGALVIYGMALGRGAGLACEGYAPRSWGLKPLRHPLISTEPVNRYGEHNLITVPINPATVDEFFNDNDWIYVYDTDHLAGQAGVVLDAAHHSLRLESSEISTSLENVLKTWSQ